MTDGAQTCPKCGGQIDEPFYDEDGLEICAFCHQRYRATCQAGEDLADKATDMPRWSDD